MIIERRESYLPQREKEKARLGDLDCFPHQGSCFGLWSNLKCSFHNYAFIGFLILDMINLMGSCSAY